MVPCCLNPSVDDWSCTTKTGLGRRSRVRTAHWSVCGDHWFFPALDLDPNDDEETKRNYLLELLDPELDTNFRMWPDTQLREMMRYAMSIPTLLNKPEPVPDTDIFQNLGLDDEF